jgi:pyruvate-formate lyase-activating enzyme
MTKTTTLKNLKETLLCKRFRDKSVQCNICQKRCLIKDGKSDFGSIGLGYCFTRLNDGGKLYTLVYSKVSCCMVSLIEKKPLFHFYPGSQWLSLGTLGCNFRCTGCQNWDIAHVQGNVNASQPEYITPQASVYLAKRHNCKEISWIYNEPTIWFAHTLDGAKSAKENGLLTNVEQAIIPTLLRLKKSSRPSQLRIFEMLEMDLREIASPFLDTLQSKYAKLSPRELEVCRLVKDGMTSKEIAEALNLSLWTVYKYRELIRRKLYLVKDGTNLQNYL